MGLEKQFRVSGVERAIWEKGGEGNQKNGYMDTLLLGNGGLE